MACAEGLDEIDRMLLPRSKSSIDEDRAITRGIMKLSQRSLARIYEIGPDIYTLEDLKVIF
jgi:hypothetical protein